MVLVPQTNIFQAGSRNPAIFYFKMAVQISQLLHIEYDIGVYVVVLACNGVSGFLLCFQIDQGGEVIHLEQGCRWIDHLVELEMELDIENAIKFVIFGNGKQYVVQGVPTSLGSQSTRCV